MASSRARPRYKQGSVGTPSTRRMQRHLAAHIHSLTADKSRPEAAEITGLSVADVHNFRAGNMPSLRFLISLVKTLRVTPESLIARGELAPLPRGRRTTGADPDKICERLRTIARNSDPAELAQQTGLALGTIYQLRSTMGTVGVHLFLGFVHAGHPASDLLLGTARPRRTAGKS